MSKAQTVCMVQATFTPSTAVGSVGFDQKSAHGLQHIVVVCLEIEAVGRF
jgi:hypothetical protein